MTLQEWRLATMNLRDELIILVRALNEAKLEYAVCGGLALTIHGFVRATQDIDCLLYTSDAADE